MVGRYLIILILLLAVPAIALDCQYTVNETYVSREDALVIENSLIKKADPLKISDFVSGEQYAFTVYNPNDFDLGVTFSYAVSGHVNGPVEKGAKIAASNYTLFKQYCYDGKEIGNCTIDPQSVAYRVTSPEVMFLKQVDVQKTRQACKQCGASNCLNDGDSCDRDVQCGSTICSIANTCNPDRIVPCPDGLVNCNNQGCLKPSTKEVGEGYACKWECKSGVGNNSICVMSADMIANKRAEFFKGLMSFFLVVALAIVILLCTAWYVKRKRLDPLTSRISELNQAIEADQETIVEINTKIARLKQEALNADGKAKKILEDALERQGALLKERQTKMDREKSELDEKSRELDEKYNELDLKLLRDLKSRYPNMVLNGEGYPVFGNNPKNTIHRYIYQKGYEEKYKRAFDKSKHVHHIDANRLNSLEMKNLIDLTEEEHSNIPHSKIKRGSWHQGLKVMMEALHWEESDLPEHIREHLRD